MGTERFKDMVTGEVGSCWSRAGEAEKRVAGGRPRGQLSQRLGTGLG